MIQEKEKNNKELLDVNPVNPVQSDLDILPKTETTETFVKQIQGDLTSRLIKMNTKKHGNKNISIDDIADIAKIRDADGIMTISLNTYSTFPSNGMPTEAWMLFDILMIEFTETGTTDDYLLKISLEKYMRLRGLKNKNHAYEQINKYFKCLQKVKITYNPKNMNLIKDFPSIKHAEISLYGGTCGISNSEICFRINPDYYKLFSGFSVLPYCVGIFKTKNDKFPHAYYFMKKLQEHSYMNRSKKNKNYISTISLTKASPHMRKYNEIKSRGQIDQRIIKPFKDTIKELERSGLLKNCKILYHCKNITLSHGDDQCDEFSKTKTPNNKNTGKTFLDSTLYFEIADYPSIETK